jgi:hypothetical protein
MTITWGKQGLGVDVDDSRQTVSQGLSGSSFSNTNDIASGKSHRPTLRLDGSRTVETLSLDLRQDVLRKTCLIESGDRTRNVPSLNGHLLLLAELVDISLRTSRDIGVLLVE